MKETLVSLYRDCFGEEVTSISEIRAHASRRRIFRLRSRKNTAVGVSNSDTKENAAFIEFTRHFLSKGLPVPRIYGVSLKDEVYLMEDLGDTAFFDVLEKSRGACAEHGSTCRSLLFQIITLLPRFQVEGAEGPHLYFCHPSREFDQSAMLRDMYYFEREFLKRTKVRYAGDALHRDFEKLASFIREAGCGFFMYRDFQSRNVMIRDGRPFFLDYQAGGKGPLQYDVVSFLYQSRADLPQALREEAMEAYLDVITSMVPFRRDDFYYYLDGFILIRLMQAMATYGVQGVALGKTYFLESIPYAIKNLSTRLSSLKVPAQLPELRLVFEQIVAEFEKGNLLHAKM